MAYDARLADRLRDALAGEPVTEKRMFGGLAFLLGGNMTVAAMSDGGLLVRVDPTDSDALLGEPGAEEFAMGGRRPMRGWVRVSGDSLDDDQVLDAWVSRGVTYARMLPAK